MQHFVPWEIQHFSLVARTKRWLLAWNCSWSSTKNYLMYCGIQHGDGYVYDIIWNTWQFLEKITPSKAVRSIKGVPWYQFIMSLHRLLVKRQFLSPLCKVLRITLKTQKMITKVIILKLPLVYSFIYFRVLYPVLGP